MADVKKSNSTSKRVVKYSRKGEKVTDFSVYLKSGSDHGLVAQWKHSKSSQAEGYEYDWEYTVDAKKWLPGSNGTTSVEEAKSGSWFNNEWTVPNDAVKARCRIRPVSKTKSTTKTKTKTKGSSSSSTSITTMYFSASWSSYKEHDFRNDKLPRPTVTATMNEAGTKATVAVECNDADCNYCTITSELYAGKDKSGNNKYTVKDKWANKSCPGGRFSGEFDVPAGTTLYFRAYCSTTTTNTKGDSDWAYRVSAKAKPSAPKNIKAQALSADSAKVTWTAANGAASYTAQYKADDANFNSDPSAVTAVTVDGTTFSPTALESGHRYYFRVKAVNNSGESGWCVNDNNKAMTASCVLATVPDAPTTYETEPAFIVGESARMRWTHNSEDESDQTAAEVSINDTSVQAGVNDYYTLDLSSYSDGTQINWKVRTKGAHTDWSPWSATRSFMVYEQPELSCTVRQTSEEGDTVDIENPLTSYPLAIVLDASGGGNQVAGYHVLIVAAEPLSYVDEFGYERVMGTGEVAFEMDYTTSDDPFVAIVTTAEGANLRDTGTYEIIADVSMKSGLRATAQPWRFMVDFDVEVPEPNAMVSFDPVDLVADIMPACYEVDENGEATTTLFEGVTLAVYRIDDDGTLVLLRKGIPNDGISIVTDPHANFGECWYHVVATDIDTGVCNFADGGDDSPHSTAVVQWNESWQQAIDADDLGDRDYDYSGMRIDGLYNIEHDENGGVQANDIEYIGREHPVSYYGTQLGYEAAFKVEFPHDDMETLKNARRLIALRDDAYVREPRGTGYWAHIVNPRISRAEGSLKNVLSFMARRVDRDDSALEEA